MTFLLGRQAIFGHDPPMYLRSITSTRCPSPAKVHAAIVPPVPLPRMTTSYSSWVSFRIEEASCMVLMCFSFSQTRVMNAFPDELAQHRRAELRMNE